MYYAGHINSGNIRLYMIYRFLGLDEITEDLCVKRERVNKE